MRLAHGTYTSDGNARTLTSGFAAKFVLIKGTDSLNSVGRFASQTGDNSFEIGNNTASFAGGITSIGATTFDVGTDSRVNTNGIVYYWVALGGSTSQVIQGTYTGNATDSTDINIGAQAYFVLIRGEGTRRGIWRSTAFSGTDCAYFNNLSNIATGIKAFNATGFQVGTAAEANANTIVYHYCALVGSVINFDTGTYTGGDPTDNKDISTVITPIFVLVKRSSATVSVFRTPSLVGDTALPFFGVSAANTIQDQDADSFQVGSSANVNAVASTYFWFAMEDGGNVLNKTLEPLTLSAQATVATTGLTGTLSKTLAALSVASTGTVAISVIEGVGQTAAITLAWDASVGATGYRIYVGNSDLSGIYNYPGSPFDVGNVLIYRLENFPNDTYYFATTAYNEADDESGFSNELVDTITAIDGLFLGSLSLVATSVVSTGPVASKYAAFTRSVA